MCLQSGAVTALNPLLFHPKSEVAYMWDVLVGMRTVIPSTMLADIVSTWNRG